MVLVQLGHQVHVVRKVLLEPLIGGAAVGETLRGQDLHLVNLLEDKDRFHDVAGGTAGQHVDGVDGRENRGAHPAGHLHRRSEAGRSGEARATERLIRFQTSQKPDLSTKELDNEEDCNSDTQAAPDDHDFSARLHVRIMQLLGDLLEPHCRRLEGAFVDLVVQEGDALDVDLSIAAGGEHNLVRLHVNEEVVAWRPRSSIHLQNIALSELCLVDRAPTSPLLMKPDGGAELF